jgi:hypothetical protein
MGTTHTCAPAYCYAPRFAYVVRARGCACRWGLDLHLIIDLLLQYPDEHTCNIQMKHMKQTYETHETYCAG